MNLQKLNEFLSEITEIKVLGKTIEINGTIDHIMGIVRRGNRLQLLALHHEEQLINEELAIDGSDAYNHFTKKSWSNREHLKKSEHKTQSKKIQSAHRVNIGEHEFNVASMESSSCGNRPWESTMIFAEFLKQGWHPIGVDYQNISELFMTGWEFTGEYSSIPNWEDTPLLRLQLHSSHTTGLLEQPITLVVGTDYPEKLVFQDPSTGKTHWIQINRVYLMDVWEEMMRIFNDPRLKNQLTPDELEKNKTALVGHLSRSCPKGMYFPVIEYECEEEMSFQFYSQAWLNTEMIPNSSSFGLIIKSDKGHGMLGFPLKNAIIQEPMPANTYKIEAELFSYYRSEKQEDLLL